MREEYLAIVAAGFILQVDDPFLIDLLSDPHAGPRGARRRAWVHVEALNHALRGHPARERCATTRATASTTGRA